MEQIITLEEDDLMFLMEIINFHENTVRDRIQIYPTVIELRDELQHIEDLKTKINNHD